MSAEKLIEQPLQKEVGRKKKPTFTYELPDYLEKHPIISRETLTFGNHEIEFINQNPDVELDQEHLHQAQEVLERIYAIAPDLVKTYEKIFITYEPGVEERVKAGPYAYAPNAKGVPSIDRIKDGSYIVDGLVFNQLGYRVDQPHRIKETNNWTGTLAHEMPHAVEKEILYKFQNELGYHPIFSSDEWIAEGNLKIAQPISGWEAVKGKSGSLEGYRHKETGYFTNYGWAPENMETVPTKYAQTKPEEDFCDSFVAYLFTPEKLDPKRKEFFEKYFPLKISKENKK